MGSRKPQMHVASSFLPANEFRLILSGWPLSRHCAPCAWRARARARVSVAGEGEGEGERGGRGRGRGGSRVSVAGEGEGEGGVYHSTRSSRRPWTATDITQPLTWITLEIAQSCTWISCEGAAKDRCSSCSVSCNTERETVWRTRGGGL